MLRAPAAGFSVVIDADDELPGPDALPHRGARAGPARGQHRRRALPGRRRAGRQRRPPASQPAGALHERARGAVRLAGRHRRPQLGRRGPQHHARHRRRGRDVAGRRPPRRAAGVLRRAPAGRADRRPGPVRGRGAGGAARRRQPVLVRDPGRSASSPTSRTPAAREGEADPAAAAGCTQVQSTLDAVRMAGTEVDERPRDPGRDPDRAHRVPVPGLGPGRRPRRDPGQPAAGHAGRPRAVRARLVPDGHRTST